MEIELSRREKAREEAESALAVLKDRYERIEFELASQNKEMESEKRISLAHRD